MTLRIRNVTVDVPAARFDAVVAFWVDALQATGPRGAGPSTALVGPAAPIGVHLQRLEGGEAGYHLELEADDVAAEVARLVGLGASRDGGGDGGEALRDPAGSSFVVRPLGQVVDELVPRTGDAAGLEFVVLDVPTEHHPASVAFWTAALGASVHRFGPPVEAFASLLGPDGPGGPIGLLVQDTGPGGPARWHVDLHVDGLADRDAEVVRLTGLGATEVSAAHHWRTLADPGGALLCVVPDHRDDEDLP